MSKGLSFEKSYPDFISLFNGLDSIGGTGEGLKKAVEWLTEREDLVLFKAFSCIVFLEKPTVLLMTGKTKVSSFSTKPVEVAKIVKSLPMLSEADINGMTLESRRQFELKRKDWINEGKYVNLTRARTAAFAFLDAACRAIEKREEVNMEIVHKWIKIYGNCPSDISDLPLSIFKGNTQSRDIKLSQIRKFQESTKLFPDYNQLIRNILKITAPFREVHSGSGLSPRSSFGDISMLAEDITLQQMGSSTALPPDPKKSKSGR